jgi:hypothetical protein
MVIILQQCGQSTSYADGIRPAQSAAAAMTAVMLLGLPACTTPSEDAWTVEPIRYDNALDGQPASMTDVTYPMGNLTSDTDGGFWAESAGSWLHISADGETLRRFNLLDGADMRTVRGIAAATPTELVVSHDALGPDGALSRFDTESMRWEAIPVAGDWIGDVAVLEGAIFYVEYSGPRITPIPFVIRKLEPGGALSTLTPAAGETFRAEHVAIDLDREGNVYVVTESQRLILAASGSVTSREQQDVPHPVVAASPDGSVLWSAGTGPDDLDWRILSASPEARHVIDQHSACADTGLAIRSNGADIALPFLCDARSAVWLDENSLALSAGTEGGAVLARVTAP